MRLKDFDHYDELSDDEVTILHFITALRDKSPENFAAFTRCSLQDAIQMFSEGYAVWLRYVQLVEDDMVVNDFCNYRCDE